MKVSMLLASEATEARVLTLSSDSCFHCGHQRRTCVATGIWIPVVSLLVIVLQATSKGVDSSGALADAGHVVATLARQEREFFPGSVFGWRAA